MQETEERVVERLHSWSLKLMETRRMLFHLR